MPKIYKFTVDDSVGDPTTIDQFMDSAKALLTSSGWSADLQKDNE